MNSPGDSREARAAGTEIGTFVAVADISLAEALGRCLDVLVIDLEHGAVDVAQAQALMIGCQAAGAKAYVRVSETRDSRLGAILDAGADGVVAPMVEDTAQAAHFASRLRYPPVGHRGFGPRRAGRYGDRSPRDEPGPVCAIQLETEGGIEASREIARTEGVDLVIVGCADLAVSLGVPMHPGSTELIAAIDTAAVAATAGGCRFGLAIGGDITALRRFTHRRIDLLLHGVDLRMYAAAAGALASALRTSVDAPRSSRGRLKGGPVEHA